MYSSPDVFPNFSCVVSIVSNYFQKNTKKNHQKPNQPSPLQKISKHIYNLILKIRSWKPNYLTTSLSIQIISLQQNREDVLHGNSYPLMLIPHAIMCVLLSHSCHHLSVFCGTGISGMQWSEVTGSLNFRHLFFQTVPACFCLFTCHFWKQLFKFN